LDLEVDFDSSGLSRLDELIDDMTFCFCGFISFRWLIPKPLVEFEVRLETGSGLYPDFFFTPQGSFEQSRQPFVGICRWFSMTPLISRTLSHYIGRNGNCGNRRSIEQIVEQRLNPFALYVLWKYCNS
jgi:hypothetical protein